MKLSAMIVQATWDMNSPLLQLPHINSAILQNCMSTKVQRRKTKEKHSPSIYEYFQPQINSCADLASMSETDRLSRLRSLDPVKYQDVMKVLSSMPKVSMEVRVEGMRKLTLSRRVKDSSSFDAFK